MPSPGEERIKLDVWYVDNWSLELDLSIMRRTLKDLAQERGSVWPGGEAFSSGLRNSKL